MGGTGGAGGTGRPEPPLGGRLPRIATPPPGPASRALGGRLRRVESRNVTYLGPEFPVFWTEARGANVRDPDGNVFLDFTGAFGVSVAGHGHPRIVEALEVQAGSLVHGMGDVHPPTRKVELLERLAALSPWDDARAVLASSGSEAVEIALKTAHLATGRPGVVAFRGGYHGLTLGALSATAREDFRAPFRARLPRDVDFVPFPAASPDGSGDPAPALDALARALGTQGPGGSPPGAVLVEPVQGRGGVHIPPGGFLEAAARLTREAGALLVLDEVFTGLGRTGTLFAFEAEGAVPDLLCLGKALGGGLPLSACLGPRSVMDAWPPSSGEALHTSTFLGHPLACAASLAVLEVLEEEGLPDRARREGDRLRKRLEKALGASGHVVEIRGRGLLLGIELAPEAAREGKGPAVRAAEAALREGLLVLPAGDGGEVVQLAPPLTVRRDQLDAGAELLARVIRGLRP